MTKPRLAITLGDPRGIGPEIVAAAIADSRVRARAELVVVGPSGTVVPANEEIGAWADGGSEQHGGRLAGLAIERATKLALAGEVQGIVTAPIDKHALFAGGYDFPGHTEMLAQLTGSHVAMMLASDRLRVVLVTTHIALANVPRELTRERIIECASITRRGLQ
ncbi:MAG: 4-hydroxythreonine-4-phosphate dehydrogenase PdxA, partial [Gemmatimonadota bacterium]|nr:4-hydroxythreonine-4-phosphate dehydrogenase PdxA [Gemmatimonadota bacterium]